MKTRTWRYYLTRWVARQLTFMIMILAAIAAIAAATSWLIDHPTSAAVILGTLASLVLLWFVWLLARIVHEIDQRREER
ncbi:hypothetical protein AS850_02915 [Frondihabitans sp. 762G35]|uniref:hypothetical protein n=1 Tax=Frondihabitans sp. 762G35 TaxID=1446794 RepID=UPI000D20F514|nr:hypothetical protein [Frondihabitans sp. 762G35]ARC56024.1 hypothetical protein AS850_02915 [Frondihabitans sp. 762G35]